MYLQYLHGLVFYIYHIKSHQILHPFKCNYEREMAMLITPGNTIANVAKM